MAEERHDRDLPGLPASPRSGGTRLPEQDLGLSRPVAPRLRPARQPPGCGRHPGGGRRSARLRAGGNGRLVRADHLRTGEGRGWKLDHPARLRDRRRPRHAFTPAAKPSVWGRTRATPAPTSVSPGNSPAFSSTPAPGHRRRSAPLSAGRHVDERERFATPGLPPLARAAHVRKRASARRPVGQRD